MSHIAGIKTKVKDPVVLAQAAAALGLKVKPDGMCRWYGGEKKMDLVFALPGPFDVGFVRQKDGTFSLQADFWGGHVERAIGEKGGKLLQLYAVLKARQQGVLMGFTASESRSGDEIHLVLRRGDGAVVTVVCRPDGSVQVHVSGMPGRTCLELRPFEEALGEVGLFQPTAEFYSASGPIRNGACLCG
jgi:hypothetical protein